MTIDLDLYELLETQPLSRHGLVLVHRDTSFIRIGDDGYPRRGHGLDTATRFESWAKADRWNQHFGGTFRIEPGE